MSATTATLLAAGLAILGTLLGTIVGLTGERFLRSRGRLLCRTTSNEVRFLPGGNGGDWGRPPVDPGEPVEVYYAFGLDLFNSKEIPVGLRDLSVVFVCEGGELVSKPREQGNKDLRTVGAFSTPLHLINLPPRQWVHVDIFGSLSDVETAQTWRRVEFVGHRGAGGLFESEEFRETIKTREGPSSRPWWRRILGG